MKPQPRKIDIEGILVLYNGPATEAALVRIRKLLQNPDSVPFVFCDHETGLESIGFWRHEIIVVMRDVHLAERVIGELTRLGHRARVLLCLDREFPHPCISTLLTCTAGSIAKAITAIQEGKELEIAEAGEESCLEAWS